MDEIDGPRRGTAAPTKEGASDREKIIRENAAKYRRFAEEVNRSGEKEMERALLRNTVGTQAFSRRPFPVVRADLVS